MPNFPIAETDAVVHAEASGAQSRIVEAHTFHPIADTEPGVTFAIGVAPPALLLAAGAFWAAGRPGDFDRIGSWARSMMPHAAALLPHDGTMMQGVPGMLYHPIAHHVMR